MKRVSFYVQLWLEVFVMAKPVIVQIIGLPGTGKTLVAKMAKRAFAWQRMKVAWLDVDHFAQCYQGIAEKEEREELRHTPRFVSDVLFVFKTRFFALKRHFTPNQLLARDSAIIKAVKKWIEEQDADVILLEHHWLGNLYFYPKCDETWVITAPPDMCLHRLKRFGGPFNGSLVQASAYLTASHTHWLGHSKGGLQMEKTLITNNVFGRNRLRRRLIRLADEIGWKQYSGKYISEEDRPTLPPAKL